VSLVAAREGDVAAEGMARDRHRVEPERLEQGAQVALVVGESIGVAMLAEAVTPEVEHDHA
jgi:hypothetical protein